MIIYILRDYLERKFSIASYERNNGIYQLNKFSNIISSKKKIFIYPF